MILTLQDGSTKQVTIGEALTGIRIVSYVFGPEDTEKLGTPGARDWILQVLLSRMAKPLAPQVKPVIEAPKAPTYVSNIKPKSVFDERMEEELEEDI